MGWFDTVGTGDADIAAKSNDGKIYKAVQLAAVIVLVLAVAIIIFEIFGAFTLNSTVNGLVISVGIIGIGGMNALPWVRIFERIKDKRFKITSIVFMALVAICVILWIICVWQIIALVNKVTASADEVFQSIINSLNTIRAVFIASMQLMVASGIGMNIVKYRKSLIPYQAMAGVAYLYIDFYIALVLTAFTITSEGEFILSPTANWINSPVLGALFFIALILLIIVGVIFARTDRRRLIATANSGVESVDANKAAAASDKAEPEPASDPATEPEASTVDSTEEKLRKIQSLYDNGLITQEEFESKRAEVLKDI